MPEQENVNVSDEMDGVVDNSTAESETEQPEQEAGPRRRGGRKGGGGRSKKKEDRVRIRVANTSEIPPSGQFIGVNGYGYMIKPNQEVSVPESVLEVLDNAVQSVPIQGSDGRVQGYQDVPRFPYTRLR